MVSIYREFNDLENIIKKSIVVIGNFDGVHLGHKAVLNYAKSLKNNNNEKVVVLTFYPHPLIVLSPEYAPQNILSFRSKVMKMKELGIDIIVRNGLIKTFLTSAENFIKIVLCKGLSVQHIVIGDDFRFGHNREGDINYLKSRENKNNFKVHIINEISGENVRYSSSIVRDMILKGKMLDTNKILGYFYQIEGRVVKGQQLGRELGFPTANVHYLNTIIPHDGVYAGWVQCNNKTYKSAISTVCRQQFKGKKRF